MKKTVLLGLIALVGLSQTVALAAGDPQKGQQLYVVCTACHGANGEGNPLLNAPVNAGLDQSYIVRQLGNFKAGIRGTDPKDTYGAQMRPMAMTLADDQAMADVAAYVGTLKAPTPPKTVTGDVEAGRKIFEPCSACHGKNAEGTPLLNAPNLANQHDWYLVRQLGNFRQGIRGSHPKDIFGTQMRYMAQLILTDEQVNDVVAYITSNAQGQSDAQ